MFVCDQCKSTYHQECTDGAQCHVCRKVYDPTKDMDNKKKLLDHYNETIDSDFYDETYDEESSLSSEDQDDDDWIPEDSYYPEQMTVGPMRITRAVASQLR